MQSPDDRHDHDPPRLRTLPCLAAGVAALVVPSTAIAARYATLPSPVAPLSAAPPLGGGAFSSSESTRHRVNAVTSVGISIDRSGTPFAITASQSLDVRVAGDYFFTIGAPLQDVAALPGSDSTPGLRSASIVWAGFNPGRRMLKAHAVLDVRPAAAALPLQIEVAGAQTTLVNATAVTVSAFTADAEQAPLLRYYNQLHTGSAPLAGAAYLTSAARRTNVTVRAPLRVSGTVGGRQVSALVTNRLIVPAVGTVRLTVSPVRPPFPPAAALSGRALLARVTEKLLSLARVRQYQSFLGNPDPTGQSTTTYRYRTAARPEPVATAQPVPRGRDWTRTAAIIAGVVVAAGVATVAWSRS